MPENIGLGALRYGSYRQKRQGEYVLATAPEMEVDVITKNITASGNTELLSAPIATSEEGIRIRGFQFSKAGGSAVEISLRQGTTGDTKFTAHLENDGDFVGRDMPHVWDLDAEKALYVNASGACDVYVTVEYEKFISRVETLELSDTMSIAEDLTTEPTVGLSDSQSIAESLASVSAFTKELTDSESIAEDKEFIREVYLDLSDTMSIAESFETDHHFP